MLSRLDSATSRTIVPDSHYRHRNRLKTLTDSQFTVPHGPTARQRPARVQRDPVNSLPPADARARRNCRRDTRSHRLSGRHSHGHRESDRQPLRDWLRRAALSGETVREHAGTFTTDPEPILPEFDRLELLSDESAVAGTYDLTATGDTRYELLVGASEADSVLENTTVTPLSTLSESRRAFTREAIESRGTRVFPETPFLPTHTSRLEVVVATASK